jgi:hypothetical protein
LPHGEKGLGSLLLDPKVEKRREPADVDRLFRRATAPFSHMSSPKALGDCYLLALSQATNATLVTLDNGLFDLAGKITPWDLSMQLPMADCIAACTIPKNFPPHGD